jgi:hypothetical protein
MKNIRTISSPRNEVVAHIDLVKIKHPDYDKSYRVIFTKVKTHERVGVPQYFATIVGAESCVRKAFHKEVAA